ncbi:Multifunctional methyltransferase subunit TRM112 B [Phytophthora citrophthora]|uniref:Multifunctional methyltransferase subunit TRM112 B n=1 Tax=Phytophthora citrophthora TaxID=4793 RepID=A0AAD9GZJ5_9STRA|nr:Multifunctional methyltransferase subunit TRM112 B [Phytophthora citrophthora]
MRLITHNLLMCNKKGVKSGYPLNIEAEEVEIVACDFQAAFVRKMLTKLDWSAFLVGAKALKLSDDLPEALPSAEEGATDEDTLRKIHHALLEVHVKQGKLLCPESGRAFPIIDGIPNMLLNEDEV